MLNRFCILLLLLTSFSASFAQQQKKGAEAAPNTLTDKEKKQGWQLLFDGTTKNGWHIFNNTSDGSGWKPVDGALFMDPTAGGGGELVTDKEYENFHFKADWKLDPGGNSGIMFLVQEDPKYGRAYVTGPEMQVLDNNGHPDAKNFKHRAGDLYDMIPATPETVKPAGEWNQAEIILNKGKLTFYLNGVKVVSTTAWNDNWKNMIANSKFRDMPGFGTFKKGKISLQDHGNNIWFRNIRIKEL